MLEKIDKIHDLLAIPNANADNETAIINMKILNLLVSMRAEAEQLNLYGVVSSFLNKEAENLSIDVEDLYINLCEDELTLMTESVGEYYFALEDVRIIK